jgi:UDPglucose 6-dehydrogenase
LWVLKDKKIGVLGLAFKQNTDDVRMSPAIDLCQHLLKEGASIRVFDPQAMEKAKSVLPPGPTITYVADMNDIALGCDAIVIATEWPEFKQLDLDRARPTMSHPILFDGRNLFDPAEMERRGWVYKSVGR